MEIIKLAIGIISFIGLFVFTAKAIYHFFHMITNTKGKYSSFLGAFILLTPSQFTETGNKHRLSFGRTLLVLIIFFVLLIFSGVF